MEEYRGKYGDIDDVKVIARRLSIDESTVEDKVRHLVDAGLIKPDKGTLEAYKTIAEREGMEAAEYLQSVSGVDGEHPPRTYEVCTDGLLEALLTVVGQHRRENIVVKFDKDACRVISATYRAGGGLRRRPSEVYNFIFRRVRDDPYKVVGLLSFWMNFFAVALSADYARVDKPVYYTLREILLHFLVEAKELTMDLTILDNGGKLFRCDRDLTRYEYVITENADKSLAGMLADPGVSIVLRLADIIFDSGEVKLMREVVLRSRHNPLQDALLWNMDFHVSKETTTRVFFEDASSAKERVDRGREEFKSKARNHYMYVPHHVRCKLWRYFNPVSYTHLTLPTIYSV